MNNIQTEISKDIRSARHSIKVAVSWLTDTFLINELIDARKRGVDVKVIVSSNELNIIRFELFQKLIDLGATVNKEGSEDAEQGDFMHYKFYIIDDKLAKSGSYNWSINAVTNREEAIRAGTASVSPPGRPVARRARHAARRAAARRSADGARARAPRWRREGGHPGCGCRRRRRASRLSPR